MATQAYNLIEKIKDEKTDKELKLAKRIVELEAKKADLHAEVTGLEKLLQKILSDKI